jgi:hypothetical protein
MHKQQPRHVSSSTRAQTRVRQFDYLLQVTRALLGNVGVSPQLHMLSACKG